MDTRANNRNPLKDWKFLATTVLTVAGVVIPLFLWQSDKSALELTAHIVSTTSMKIDIADDSSGSVDKNDVQILIGNEIVSEPYLSTIELTNSGSKSIPSAYYEGPIRFTVPKNTKIVRSIVTAEIPDNLNAKLDAAAQSVSIQPILLNPEDSIRISVITDGPSPEFVVESRIAGISAIKLDDGTKPKTRWAGGLIYSIFGVGFFFSYVFFAVSILAVRPVRVHPLACVGLALSTCTASIVFMRMGTERLNVEVTPLQQNLLLGSTIFILAVIFRKYIFKIIRERTNGRPLQE